jgi:hypothetical protein
MITIDINLERTVLGELILETPEIIDNSLAILHAYDFNDTINVKIFETIKSLRKDSKNIDIMLIESISGVDAMLLTEITSIASTANLNEHISQLRNITLKRKVIKGYSQAVEQLDNSINPSNDIIKFASKLIKLSEFSIDKGRSTALEDIKQLSNKPAEKRFNFGISFLNDALGGFHEKDVIVLASRTGRGKSEMCSIIAEKTAIDKKRVLYLALEAESFEIGARIKFRTLCRLFFNDNPSLIYPLSFDDWMADKLKILDKYNDLCDRILAEYAGNIFVEYRKQEFTIDDLDQQFKKCHDIDLIILDHIHYVDINDDNENKGLKKIIKCIRSNNLIYKKPIIVVAHLRKTDKKQDGLIPDEDDIYGSSDLAKIVTKTILFSPDYTVQHDYLYRTFFHICKYRRNPSALRYIANLKFDARFNLYEDKYKLGQYKPFGKEFIECDKFPNWYPEHYKYN